MSRYLAIALMLGVTSVHAELAPNLAYNMQQRVIESLDAKVDQAIEDKAAELAVKMSEHAALQTPELFLVKSPSLASR